jgi:lysophospholipase L1-like esterase
VSDFLQPEARVEESRFSVHTNSLGFRDPERSVRKPADTYRVICLGSYQTFGHGVADGEAYPQQLERLLNARSGTNRTFEVWNGGKLGATAIMGLARLTVELFDYEPDALIVEYGFVDQAVVDDGLLPSVLSVPGDHRIVRTVMDVLHQAVRGPLGRSFLFAAVLHHLGERQRPNNLARWKEVSERIIALARDRGVPVILLDHVTVSTDQQQLYEQLTASSPGVLYCSVKEAFLTYPPLPEQIAQFDRQENWAAEFGPLVSPLKQYATYFVDMLHPSAQGHEAIARLLLTAVDRVSTRQALALAERGAP